MEITIDSIVQALPIIGSAVTALIVFVRKGTTKDISIAELKQDVKDLKDKLNTMLTDIAVLKVKVDNKN